MGREAKEVRVKELMGSIGLRVGVIARSAEMQDCSHTVEYCLFIYTLLFNIVLYPFIVQHWTDIYLKHAMCQCRGDTSGEEDKYRPHCVAVHRWMWHTRVDNKYTKSWALGVLRLSCVSDGIIANKMYFPPYFTYRIFLQENVCPFLWAGLNFPSRISPSVFNLMQPFYHILC